MPVSRAIQLLARTGGSRRLYTNGGATLEEELGSIPLGFPSVCIWGSNTGVGKTLFSAGLAAAAQRAGLPVLYLKPAQTGFPADSDARLVAAAARLPLTAGPHAAQLDSQLPASAMPGGSSSSSSSSSGNRALAKTLYAWQQAVSPHLAVEREGRPVSDRQLAADVAAELRAFAALGGGTHGSCGAASRQLVIVETAGGVASPGPSGALQCDMLRPLRLPGVLVGDGRLGGISATLSAYDSLALRGHQVPLLVLMDGGQQLDNAKAIQRYLRGKAVVLPFPACQPPPASHPSQQQRQQQRDEQGLPAIDANLAAWLEESCPQFDDLLHAVSEAHSQRLAKLQAAAGEARDALWWPFTQHTSVAGVTVIDSRVGESFSVFQPAPAPAAAAAAAKPAAEVKQTAASEPAAAGAGTLAAAAGAGEAVGGSAAAASSGGSLQLMYDSCASWWTQGVSQQAHPELVRAVSAAAARYGHVMFPENTHEPALELAKKLLAGVGAGWAARVFYTDNGSTAIEVALKMAFRTFMADQGLLADERVELQVLGLTEAYHGDTLGAMDAVPPSAFNGRLQAPWYRGRGLFLDPPVVAVRQGMWHVQLPPGLQDAADTVRAADALSKMEFSSQDEVFALGQRMDGGGGAASLHKLYRQHIEQQLDRYRDASAQLSGEARRQQAAPPQGGSSWQAGQARQLGACIVEPVLQGAGGMRLIDPLYQRTMVDVCRERGIPVVYDEVFTGFWRLGATSGAALLGTPPDIACYAKLLTGGLVPLAATLATADVFDAFVGDSKAMALLHGHSYTAHPIGCSAGVEALQLYQDPSLNPNWCTPEAANRCQKEGQGSERCDAPCGRLLPLWSAAAVAELSRHPAVQGVMPLGTVLAVQLRAQDGVGYASNAAAVVVARLRRQGIFGRPLGDVVYLMVTPMTARAQCDALLTKLVAALGG